MKFTRWKAFCLSQTVVIAVLALSGCAITSPIQPVATSKSKFDDAVYSGETVTISAATPGGEEFRVFHQGASSFVSIQTIRTEAEQRATDFCVRKSKVMKPLRETNSKPPHVLGNFPRVEIVFECVDRPQVAAVPISL